MMKYPLAIEQFQYSEFEDNAGKEFIIAFINVVNDVYELGRKANQSNIHLMDRILKGWHNRVAANNSESAAVKMFLDVFREYLSDAWQQGLSASGKIFDIPADTIKIYPCFRNHPPKMEKMKQKEQYFMETGLLQSQIILDGTGTLIDGYTSYLLAVKHGIDRVSVRYRKRQIVKASHTPKGKLYTWELPPCLVDKVTAGSKVIVHTSGGVRTVTVTAVEDYAGNEYKLFRAVIGVKKKSSQSGTVSIKK